MSDLSTSKPQVAVPSVSKESAIEEITQWLDYKKLSENKREAQKDQIDTLVEAMVDGSLVLQPDKTLVQKLKWEIGEGSGATKSLSYKPRLRMSEVHEKMHGVKSSDADGRIIAYVCALTSEAKGIIKAMDTEDYSIAQAIAIFFCRRSKSGQHGKKCCS